jgi:hypothetical protein
LKEEQTMATITGELDLSGISKDDFNKDLGLRVAVVRGGKVLGSTDLKPPAETAKRVSFEVEFKPVLNPGVLVPCGVIVVVGPQVSDRELLAVDTLKHTVNFSPAAAQKNRPAHVSSATESAQKERAAAVAVNIGTLVVDPALYLCWIYCCATYKIRGRLTCRDWFYNPQTQRYSFCDNPVPGATVSIYDVHCFFWWCWRSLIGTATTDINGNFNFTFRWCCFRWLPWLDTNWIVDQSLYRSISQLLALAKLPVPPLPGPGPDPAIFKALLTKAAGQRRSSSRALPGNTSALSTSSLSREALLSVLPASPELEALHVWPWWPWYDCGPNIVFEATQLCRDRREVVYSETNAQARWDIGTNTNVTLVANDNACCLPTCNEPPCPDCLAFSLICSTPSDQISANPGPPDLRGYAYTAAVEDLAFTQVLEIHGDLGAGIDYYKVQYSYNGGSWTDLPIPAFEGFSEAYWGPLSPPWVSVLSPGFYPVVKSGQTVIISRDHYAALNGTYTIGGHVLWEYPDTLFNFNTLAPGIINGLYELQLVGYTADAADNLTNQRVVPLCGHDAAATMFVRVNNKDTVHPPATPTHPFGNNPPTCVSTFSSNHICTLQPECYFRQICKNEGKPDMQCFAACDIIHLSLKADDTLTIHFTVSCPPNTVTNPNDALLGGYTLEGIYGASDVLTIGTATSTACPSSVTDPVGIFEADPPLPSVQVGPTYAQALSQGATRPFWSGGDYKVTLRACDFAESCAFDFQLCAWIRTTNGCTVSGCQNLDYNIFDLTVTIEIDP